MWDLRTGYRATLAMLLACAGCDSRQKDIENVVTTLPITRNVLETNRIVQTTNNFFIDGVLKVGVVSDIEGALENARKSAAVLRGEKVDLVLIAGDLYENERIRRNPMYPQSRDNVLEMIEGIRPYAELGVPVFLVAGNHEEYPVYTNALARLHKEFPQVYDLSGRSADLHGINIVGLGGYHDPRFIAQQGFQIKKEDYQRAENEIRELMQQQDPLIFITHGPPLAPTTNLIDYVEGFGHVGDSEIARILSSTYARQITHVSGHIHEGGGIKAWFPAGISLNVASITLFQNPYKLSQNVFLQYLKK